MQTKDKTVKPPINYKEMNAHYSFRVAIRDVEHFYKLVKWLNENVGKGTSYWTMEGKVLKKIKSGNRPSVKIYIFKEDFDESSSLYLSLL